jgi:hypothetical protein
LWLKQLGKNSKKWEITTTHWRNYSTARRKKFFLYYILNRISSESYIHIIVKYRFTTGYLGRCVWEPKWNTAASYRHHVTDGGVVVQPIRNELMAHYFVNPPLSESTTVKCNLLGSMN